MGIFLPNQVEYAGKYLNGASEFLTVFSLTEKLGFV
jgi:hypothetical protein